MLENIPTLIFRILGGLFLCLLGRAAHASNGNVAEAYGALRPGMAKVDSGNVWVRKMAREHPVAALEMARKNEALARRLGYAEGQVRAISRIGWAFDFGGHADSAESYYRRAAERFAEMGLLPEAADNMNNLGIVHFYQEEIPACIEAYERTLELRWQTQDSAGAAKVYNNLGVVYKRHEQLPLAIDQFERSCALKEALGDTLGLLTTVSNLSNAYQQIGQLEESERLSRRIIRIMEERGLESMVAPEMINLATTLKRQGKAGAAEQMYRASILRLENLPPNSYTELEKASHNLGRLLNEQGRFREAIPPLQKSLDLGTALSLSDVIQASRDQLAIAYAGLGKWELAYGYLRKFEADEEAARNRRTAEALADRVVRYQLDSVRQAEAAKLALETERRRAAESISQEKDRKNQLLILGGTIVSVLFVIALVLFLINRRNQIQLRRNEILLRASLQEKELLMREVHHRVNNNIQSIRSMLNIQRRKSESPALRADLDEVLNRINAMALIHSRLYGRRSLQDLDLATYLEDLSRQVFETLGLAPPQLQLGLSVDPVVLPVDTLLTLGLIVNETLTNAGKYGCEANGSLQVRLEVHAKDGQLEMKVWNHGGENSPQRPESFGFSMLEALVRKLQGEWQVVRGQGHLITINIPFDGSTAT